MQHSVVRYITIAKHVSPVRNTRWQRRKRLGDVTPAMREREGMNVGQGLEDRQRTVEVPFVETKKFRACEGVSQDVESIKPREGTRVQAHVEGAERRATDICVG